MRTGFWLAIALLAGCRNESSSLTAEWQAARDLLRSERYDPALAKADIGLAQAKQLGDVAGEWRFRLLKAEVLVGKREPARAIALLDRDPPIGRQWAES